MKNIKNSADAIAALRNLNKEKRRLKDELKTMYRNDPGYEQKLARLKELTTEADEINDNFSWYRQQTKTEYLIPLKKELRLLDDSDPEDEEKINVIKEKMKKWKPDNELKEDYNDKFGLKSFFNEFPLPSMKQVFNAVQHPSSMIPNIELNELVRNAWKGEFHAPLHEGTAHYMGPGTDVLQRVKEGVKPVGAADELAYEHDLRYMLAKNEDETRYADEIMYNTMNKVNAAYSDKLIGKGAMGLKMMSEKLGLLSRTAFNDFSTQLTPEDRNLLLHKLAKQVGKREGLYGKAQTSYEGDTVLGVREKYETIDEAIAKIEAEVESQIKQEPELAIQENQTEPLQNFNFQTSFQKPSISALLKAVKKQKRKIEALLPARFIRPRLDQTAYVSGGLQSQTDMSNVGPLVANANLPLTNTIDLLQRDVINYKLHVDSAAAI